MRLIVQLGLLRAAGQTVLRVLTRPQTSGPIDDLVYIQQAQIQVYSVLELQLLKLSLYLTKPSQLSLYLNGSTVWCRGAGGVPGELTTQLLLNIFLQKKSTNSHTSNCYDIITL